MNTLEQQTVIVTGGNSGIGQAIARAFVQQGADVLIVGRNEETLREAARALGEKASWYRADVSESVQVREAVAQMMGTRQKVDVLVNAAGCMGSVSADTPFEQAERTWDAVLNANLKGSFLMALAITPYLTRPGGRIINISSIGAYTGGSSAGGQAYAAAKAGVHGLTFALARELSPQGITVNAIAPGFIPGTRFFGGAVPEERIQKTVRETPVGRVGRPEDIAAAALYLASPEASFVTGEVLNVNGGWLFGR